MPASVTIEDNEAEFEASEADERATLALCDLLEEADRGRMTLIELASRLRELTEAAPEHIDARAHLGSVLRESEQLQEAAAEYERAFEIGSKALPTDFDGRIEWIRLDMRSGGARRGGRGSGSSRVASCSDWRASPAQAHRLSVDRLRRRLPRRS